MSQQRIAIFISGGGSNARKIIEYFYEERRGTNKVARPNNSGQLPAQSPTVALVVSNRPDAAGLLMAAEKGIPTLVLDRKVFRESEQLLEVLAEHQITFIALAGFLWLIPPYLVREFPNRIVNIHPALLPQFGGKGMYGMNVHRAVKAAGATESGPTIHFVNEQYDEGGIIFQARTNIEAEDTSEDIAAKVLQLEHAHYPRVIEEVLAKL